MLEDFLREVVDAGARRVVLDFAEVTFMDSSGLGLLVDALKLLRAASLTMSTNRPGLVVMVTALCSR
jgi:anti-sigma B factor antagonist